MVVIPISIGTLFGLWLICGVVYFALAGLAAVVAGVLKVVEALFGTGRRTGRTPSLTDGRPTDAEVATIAESLRRIGCPPERAMTVAREMLTRIDSTRDR